MCGSYLKKSDIFEFFPWHLPDNPLKFYVNHKLLPIKKVIFLPIHNNNQHTPKTRPPQIILSILIISIYEAHM